MGKLVEKIVTQDSFDARGVFVPAGHPAVFDEDLLNGEEKHIKDFSEVGPPAVVEVAALGPTGPNPKMPQQLPPDAVQLAGGGYGQPGKVLVAEATASADVRLSEIEDGREREADVSKALAEAMDAGGPGSTSGNADDNLVAGSVKEVTADLGAKTDDELAALKAAENDREKPRSGVLNAIDAELADRASKS